MSILQLMGVVSVAMLMLSLGLSSMNSVARAVRDPSALNNSMLRAMAIDGFDPTVRSSFSAMQLEVLYYYFLCMKLYIKKVNKLKLHFELYKEHFKKYSIVMHL